MMVLLRNRQRENAMKAFITKFTASIVATLCCFDRVIFKGYLPFGGDEHLNSFVDYGLCIRRKDFIPMLAEYSETLVNHAKAKGRIKRGGGGAKVELTDGAAVTAGPDLDIVALDASNNIATTFTGQVGVALVDNSGGGACASLPLVKTSGYFPLWSMDWIDW